MGHSTETLWVTGCQGPPPACVERHGHEHAHIELAPREVDRFVARKVGTEAAGAEAGLVPKQTDSTVPLYTRRNGVAAAHLRG